MAAPKHQNAYAILGLNKGASAQEIKQAYIAQVKKYDPETHTERFMVVQNAFDRLRDPTKHAQEDIGTFNYIKGEFIFNNDERNNAPDTQIAQALQALEQKKAQSALPQEEIDQKLVQVYMIRSWKKIQKKQWADAIHEWQHVLKIDPGHRRAKNNLLYSLITLGYSYATHELYEEAVDVWSQAVQMNPDSVALMHNLALANDLAGRTNEAARYWEETIKRWQALRAREPDNEHLKNCIIAALRSHGERNEGPAAPISRPSVRDAAPRPAVVGAGGTPPQPSPSPGPALPRGGKSLRDYREIVKLNPDDFEARYRIAGILMQDQKWDEAIEGLTTMRDKWPRNVEVLNLLGWALLNASKVDEAFMMWRRARAIEPKNFQITESLIKAHMTMGRTLRDKGLFTPCLVHFKALMRYLPDSDEVHYEIAETYRRKGDERPAYQEYQRVLKLNPKHKGARNGLAALKLRR